MENNDTVVDIIGDLGIEEPKETPVKNNKQKVNMYEEETIENKEIDTEKFDKQGHSFMVHTFQGDTSDEDFAKVEKMIYGAAVKLSKKKFLFRVDASQDDNLAKKILAIDGIKSRSFMPNKKFNPDVNDKAIFVNSHRLPFEYAHNIFGAKFMERKPGSRAFFAAKVMAALGEDMDNPVDFILAYSPSGHEFFQSKKDANGNWIKIDYSKVGTLSFYINMAKKIGIPVINFKNEQSVRDFVNTYLNDEENK